MIVLVLLGALAAASIAGTVVAVARDGYRRVPTRTRPVERP